MCVFPVSNGQLDRRAPQGVRKLFNGYICLTAASSGAVTRPSSENLVTAEKLATSLNCLEPLAPLFRELKLLSVHYRNVYQTCIFM